MAGPGRAGPTPMIATGTRTRVLFPGAPSLSLAGDGGAQVEPRWSPGGAGPHRRGFSSLAIAALRGQRRRQPRDRYITRHPRKPGRTPRKRLAKPRVGLGFQFKISAGNLAAAKSDKYHHSARRSDRPCLRWARRRRRSAGRQRGCPGCGGGLAAPAARRLVYTAAVSERSAAQCCTLQQRAVHATQRRSAPLPQGRSHHCRPWNTRRSPTPLQLAAPLSPPPCHPALPRPLGPWVGVGQKRQGPLRPQSLYTALVRNVRSSSKRPAGRQQAVKVRKAAVGRGRAVRRATAPPRPAPATTTTEGQRARPSPARLEGGHFLPTDPHHEKGVPRQGLQGLANQPADSSWALAQCS